MEQKSRPAGRKASRGMEERLKSCDEQREYTYAAGFVRVLRVELETLGFN